jgi:hypothetical protein
MSMFYHPPADDNLLTAMMFVKLLVNGIKVSDRQIPVTLG